MRLTGTSVAFLLLLLFFSPLHSATTPGSQLFYLGMGARQFALGGSAVSSGALSSEDIYYNPAAMAYNEQLRIGLNWGSPGSDRQYAGGGASWLIDRGVLTISGGYSGYSGTNSADTGTAFLLKGAFSKRITPTFLFGFGATLSGAFPQPEDKLKPGISADLGFILLGEDPQLQKKMSGFTFSGFRFGFSLLNLGLNPVTDSGRPFPDPAAKAGIGFDLFRSNPFDLSFRTDLTLPLNDFALRWGCGVNIGLLGFLNLRAGVQLGNPDLGPFTIGASIKPDAIMKDNPLEISWAMIPVKFNGKKENAHFFSLNFTLGGLDRTPPEVRFTSKYKEFSPNGDGSQDTVPFALSVKDNRILKGWRIELKDSKGNLIRTLSNRNSGGDRRNLKWFFKRLFAKEGSVDSPSAWIWDGKNAGGTAVPDGIYSYQAFAVDAKQNKGFSPKGTIIVDSTPPKAHVSINPKLFSPNRDGRLDRTFIRNRTDGPAKLWTGEIRDRNGKTIKQWRWPLSPPAKLPWDGKDNRNNRVKDGRYRYILKGVDPAGNRVSKKTGFVTVSTKSRAIDSKADPAAISPNGDGFLDSTSFRHSLPEARYFNNWFFEIRSAKGKKVRSFSGKSMPATILQWDGKDDSGQRVPDGLYDYRIGAGYRDGDRPLSTRKKILVDTTPPQISLKIKPRLFSPDADGYNDKLSISVSIKDASPIKKWKLVIRKKKEIFKTFTGNGSRGKNFTLTWDGRGDKGGTVESATFYSARMSATDTLGNTGKSGTKKIEIDILIIKTARGLKIRISNIEFELNKWNLKRKRSPILDRVAEVLKRYGTYKVIIEGHTDRSGNFNYNLMLSTRRARTVMRYLIHRGIDEDRMLAKGLGPTVPIASNWTAAGRAKNRRVEFILVKEE